MSESVQFDRNSLTVVNTDSKHNGNHIAGCKITGSLQEVPHPISNINDITPDERSFPISTFSFETGNLIDISYDQASKNVNTPYRVSQLEFSRWSEYINSTNPTQTKRREFVALLEPLQQQAGLLLLVGCERKNKNTGENSVAVFDVYMKHPWTDPDCLTLQNIEWFQTNFENAGFIRKDDRNIAQISVVFDEIVAEHTSLEPEFFATVI